MTDYNPYHDFRYARQAPPNEPEDQNTDRQLLPELRDEHMANTFSQSTPSWSSVSDVSQPSTNRMRTLPSCDLPLESIEQDIPPSETRTNQSRRYQLILPAPPRDQYQSSRNPVAHSYPDGRHAISPGSPLPANTINPFTATGNPSGPSEPTKPIQSGESLKCTWPGCRSSRTFGRMAELKRHLESIHINPKKYPCEFEDCGCVFSRGDNLKGHVKKIHGGDST